jgi:hypothetical protein
MRVELVGPESPRWSAFVERVPHDFYQLPAYVRASATYDGGAPRAVLVDDGQRTLLLPTIVRSIPGAPASQWDAVSPYGYPGFLVETPPGEEVAFATAALDAARGELRAQGCVSLFVRMHPLLGPVPSALPSGLILRHGETVALDLSRTDDEMWRETMSGHRNEINRALRAGHRAYVDDAFEHVARFVEIYQATMRRVGAGGYYFFSGDYVAAMRDALGDTLKLVVVEIAGAIAGAGLFVHTGDIVEYHLSGVDDAFINARPTKLMLHYVRAWARERGAKVLHLGGGLGGAADSLFKFKAGFGKGRGEFHTLRLVVDEDAYAALRRERGGTETAPAELSGFFPAYRAPVAAKT